MSSHQQEAAIAAQCAAEERRQTPAAEILALTRPATTNIAHTRAMLAIPTIQVLLARFAPEAPTLVGSLNLFVLNLANASGAVAGAMVLTAGFGVLTTSWADLSLVALGLFVFAVAVAPALRTSADAAVGTR